MKKRTTVSLEEAIIEKAQLMMQAESFGDFSGFLEQVIRERWAEKQGQLKDAPNTKPHPREEHAVNYSSHKSGAKGKTRTARKLHGQEN